MEFQLPPMTEFKWQKLRHPIHGKQKSGKYWGWCGFIWDLSNNKTILSRIYSEFHWMFCKLNWGNDHQTCFFLWQPILPISLRDLQRNFGWTTHPPGGNSARSVGNHMASFPSGNQTWQWENGGFIQYPLVMTNIAIEHGHRNSWFTHSKWRFSIAM